MSPFVKTSLLRPFAVPMLSGVILLAAIYGIQASVSNALANRDQYSVGKMAAFVFRTEWDTAGDVSFVDGTGAERTLADWRGRVVLLNLWATWCAPCRHEMPALDRLQGDLGSDDFEVVALSVDRKGMEASSEFLAEIDTENLGLYVDDTARAQFDLRARGLPSTLLIDREGRVIGALIGPAEWDSGDAVRLIEAAIAGEILSPDDVAEIVTQAE